MIAAKILKEVAMEAMESNRKQSTAADDMRRSTSLLSAMGIMRADERSVPLDPDLTTTRPLLQPFLFDFIGHEPFGFSFTAGRGARFHVPSGHRFVVEHVNIACWAKDDRLTVQLVTKSSSRCCTLTQAHSPLQPLTNDAAGVHVVGPIWVQGSSVSTFLFSNGEVHESSVVPPETYVQVWGYLEPMNGAVSF
jgi:hypothetical protein